MKKYIALSTACSLIVCTWVSAQELTLQEKRELDKTAPASTIFFEKDDSLELRVAKTAKCVPSPRQLAWQTLEYTCFIHFGPNTFTGNEWGNGKEDASVFNPPQVDTDQWCKVARDAGMKLMLITVKHHDGYCTWQTRYNEKFSVKQSPWKDGKGDVLRLLSESCRKYGLKLGVYLSPADLYQIENEEGLYGNLSKYRKSVIPTDPSSFSINPLKGRTPPDGRQSFTYEADDYNRLMLNQLYELLTEYGPVDEVWFDGAHPKRKGGQKYTRQDWYEMIHALAPNACIAIKGPDVRWCGNEAGHTRKSEWSPVAVTGKRSEWDYADMCGEDLGSRTLLPGADFVHWYPSEVNTSIRHGWFWRDEKQRVKSADVIYNNYERAVGGNGLFLLNVPPNRDGRFAPRDVEALLTSGKRIKKTYGSTAAELRKEGNIYAFNKSATINRCMIMEDVATYGQRVEKHALDAWVDGGWKEIASATIIGYKRILVFPSITTDRLRLRILEQRLDTKVSHLSVHYDMPPHKAPTITRDKLGVVTIKAASGSTVLYTIDGSAPTSSSTTYLDALPLPFAKGGDIKAVAVRDGEFSEVASVRFDVCKAKWRIHSVSSENPSSGEGAAKAIDSDPLTLWHSKWSGGTDPMPHFITIDFGEALDLKGFSYLPRHKSPGGVLDKYRCELSRDAKTWVEAAEGRFDNIINDPTQRDIIFGKMHSGIRYLRLTALHSIEDKPHSSAAEVGVLTR